MEHLVPLTDLAPLRPGDRISIDDGVRATVLTNTGTRLTASRDNGERNAHISSGRNLLRRNLCAVVQPREPMDIPLPAHLRETLSYRLALPHIIEAHRLLGEERSTDRDRLALRALRRSAATLARAYTSATEETAETIDNTVRADTTGGDLLRLEAMTTLLCSTTDDWLAPARPQN